MRKRAEHIQSTGAERKRLECMETDMEIIVGWLARAGRAKTFNGLLAAWVEANKMLSVDARVDGLR